DQLASRELRTEALDSKVVPTNIVSASPPTAQPERQDTGLRRDEAPAATVFHKPDQPTPTRQPQLDPAQARTKRAAASRKRIIAGALVATAFVIAVAVGAVVFGNRV